MGVNHPLYDELKKREPDTVNIFTLDPSRETISIGRRWLYKRPGCEYIQSSNMDYYVVKDGEVQEILRNSWNQEVPDIRVGARVRVESYMPSGTGTVTKIIVPGTDRRRTDDILMVKLDTGHEGYYKIGEVRMLNDEKNEAA